MADRNPYVIGVPLTNDAAFYGRQDVFRFIHDVLDAEKQNVIVLYGQRRIGKTSVLHGVGRGLERYGSFFPVYYDLQGKERLNLGDVLENLAQTLVRRLKLDRPDPRLFDEDGIYFRDKFLPLAFERLRDKRLVLLMDEFDVLSDELESPRAASKTLFPYLQDLIVTRSQIGFVFVVGRRIEELATHFQAIFKQAVYRRIGHLKEEESCALIVEPAQGMLSYTDDAIGRIQRLAAGHPYFTQLICFEAFNAARSNGHTTVTADLVETVVSRAIESGHGALNWFWEGLPRAERFVLASVAQVSNDSGLASKEAIRQILEQHRIVLSGLELKDAPDRLVDWEMLRREGSDDYRFVVELVRRWVMKEHPLSSARRDVDFVNKRAVRLYENAREAHSEGELEYARDEYRRALRANPNHSGAQLGLALVLYELGEFDESIVEYERTYQIDEMSARDGLIRARLAKAKTLEEQNQSDGAITQYEQVLKLVPAEETSVHQLGIIWQARAEAAVAAKDGETAAGAFRVMLQYDRSEVTLDRMKRVLLAGASDAEAASEMDQALFAYTTLNDLLPDNDEVKTKAVAFALRGGQLLESQGRFDSAVDLYGRILDLFRGDSGLSARLDVVLQKVQERENINRTFDEAFAARRAGQMDRARNAFKKLIEMDVLSYKGENIATLLAETIAAPPAPLQRQPAAPQPHPIPQQTSNPARTTLGIIVMILVGVAIAYYIRRPASLEHISLPQRSEVKIGRTVMLFPSPVYDSNWRRPGAHDYQWVSSDESVATVTPAGSVTGIAPGIARITAAHEKVRASVEVIVSQWDIPSMKADIVDIRFRANSKPNEPALLRHARQTRFGRDRTAYLYAYLYFRTDTAFKDRRRQAPLSFTLFRPDGISEGRLLTATLFDRAWSDPFIPVRLDLATRLPGKYRIEFKHNGNIIATANFEIV